MYLIVNADDFGLSKGVNYGILEAIKDGVVTCTTMMANKYAFSHAIDIYKREKLDVGIHLVLTTGRPISKDVDSLVDSNGNFYKLSEFEEKSKEFKLDELEKELLAQIEKIENAGIKLTHLDSHHHIHTSETVKNVFLKIADKMNIPFRNIEPDIETKNSSPVLDTSFYADGVSIENFKNITQKYNTEVLEIMVHPAYLDETLKRESGYHMERIEENSILTSDELKEYIRSKNINLIGYEFYKKEFYSRG